MAGRANTKKQFSKSQRIIEGKSIPHDPEVERHLKLAVAATQEIPDERIIEQFAAYLRLSDRTVARYKGTLTEFMHFLDGTKLDEARRTDVISFINYITTDRTRTARDGAVIAAPLSPSSVKNAVAALKAFYGFLLYMDELRDYDPMRGIQTPKVMVTRGDILTKDEVLALLEAPGTLRDRIQCWTLAYTACRTEELRSLKWSDIDFERQLIFILGKGQKYRTLDIHEKLGPELWKWRKQQRDIAQKNPAIARALHHESTAYVFLTNTGKPLAPGAMWKALNRRAVRAGVRVKDVELDKRGRKKDNGSEVTCHMLRRTFATTLLRSGIQLDAVADVLGHASLDTTRRHYAFSSDDRRKATINSFDVG